MESDVSPLRTSWTPTTKFVFDAYAWIEYLEGSSKGTRVRDILENPTNTIITSPVTLAEIVSKFYRTNRDPKIAMTAIENISTVHPVTINIARLTGEVHAEQKKRKPDFSLGDALVLATARSTTSRILTGDPHFKGLPETIML